VISQAQEVPDGASIATVVLQKADASQSFGLGFVIDEATGMKEVDFIEPGGLADGKLEMGDAILSFNGTDLAGLDYDACVDLVSAGTTLTVRVERFVAGDGFGRLDTIRSEAGGDAEFGFTDADFIHAQQANTGAAGPAAGADDGFYEKLPLQLPLGAGLPEDAYEALPGAAAQTPHDYSQATAPEVAWAPALVALVVKVCPHTHTRARARAPPPSLPPSAHRSSHVFARRVGVRGI